MAVSILPNAKKLSMDLTTSLKFLNIEQDFVSLSAVSFYLRGSPNTGNSLYHPNT